MVLTPPMVFAQTDGIVSVLHDHTRTRGPSLARMRDFFSSPSRNQRMFKGNSIFGHNSWNKESYKKQNVNSKHIGKVQEQICIINYFNIEEILKVSNIFFLLLPGFLTYCLQLFQKLLFTRKKKN